jgi:hypothetical protein
LATRCWSGLKGWQQKSAQLVENDRQGEDEREHQSYPDRRRKRLPDAERDRLVSFRGLREAGDRLLQLWADAPERRTGLGSCAAARALEGVDHQLQLGSYGPAALLHPVSATERPVTRPNLFLGLVRKRLVDESQQRVVLPHAKAERDGERRQRDDQPRAQLL